MPTFVHGQDWPQRNTEEQRGTQIAGKAGHWNATLVRAEVVPEFSSTVSICVHLWLAFFFARNRPLCGTYRDDPAILPGRWLPQKNSLVRPQDRRLTDFPLPPFPPTLIFPMAQKSPTVKPQAVDQPADTAPSALTRRPSSLADTHVIYCGDNLEQLAKLPDACVDLRFYGGCLRRNRRFFQAHRQDHPRPDRPRHSG